MATKRRILLATLAAGWVALVLACGGGGNRRTAPPGPTASAPAPAPRAEPAREAEPAPPPKKKAPFPPPALQTAAAEKAKRAHKIWQDLQGLRPEVVAPARKD